MNTFILLAHRKKKKKKKAAKWNKRGGWWMGWNREGVTSERETGYRENVPHPTSISNSIFFISEHNMSLNSSKSKSEKSLLCRKKQQHEHVTPEVCTTTPARSREVTAPCWRLWGREASDRGWEEEEEARKREGAGG